MRFLGSLVRAVRDVRTAVGEDSGECRWVLGTGETQCSAKNLPPMTGEIVRMRPRRVIFNPGTKSVETIEALRRAGIDCIEACTLVMLKTGQF